MEHLVWSGGLENLTNKGYAIHRPRADDPCAHIRKNRARDFHHQPAIRARGQFRQTPLCYQFIDARKLPQQLRLFARKRALHAYLLAAISA